MWFGSNIVYPNANIKRITSSFHESGFYTLRHYRGFLMTCLHDYKYRPSHMDQLHLDLWHRGVNIFCDSGTYSYASNIGNELSSTVAHNTVRILGAEQMNKNGAFLVTNWTIRKDVTHDTKSFSGTMISRNGYKHKRNIKTTECGYMVYDEVYGNVNYCDFNFHTPCEVNINDLGFQLMDNDKIICSIRTSGDIKVKKTYRSLYYLQIDEMNCISVKYKMKNKKCEANFNIILHD